VEIQVPVPGVGLNEPAEDHSLRIYPVPAAEEVIVEVGRDPEAVRYEVFDATGRLVAAAWNRPVDGRVRIDISRLAAGQYQLRLQCGGSTRYGRLCVAH
jgi:hypothetical protein